MYYFCTYFDRNYLPKGLALYQSLKRNIENFRLWILCMDQETYKFLSLLNLPEANLISLDQFENEDTKLLAAKRNRSRVEYYFTCTPSLPLFVFARDAQADLVTYLDADLYFFSSPLSIFEEIDDHSIAIIPHKFPPSLQYLEKNGIYNVGWLSFRRDEAGIACLERWRNQCLEWCYDRNENGRYADQKYLDDWPLSFENVVVLKHKGANLAPWNISNYDIRFEDGTIRVDEQNLIFYHFQGLFQTRTWLYQISFLEENYRANWVVRRKLYSQYIEELTKIDRNISFLPGKRSAFRGIRGKGNGKTDEDLRYLYFFRGRLQFWFYVAKNMINGRYLFVLFNKVM